MDFAVSSYTTTIGSAFFYRNLISFLFYISTQDWPTVMHRANPEPAQMDHVIFIFTQNKKREQDALPIPFPFPSLPYASITSKSPPSPSPSMAPQLDIATNSLDRSTPAVLYSGILIVKKQVAASGSHPGWSDL